MSVDALLSRLSGVRKTGAGRWMARCPAHEDKRSSLSIRETQDGTVLVNCFAGCGAAEVVAAAGLEFDALFPPRRLYERSKMRRRVFRDDAFDRIRFEAAVIYLIGCDLHKRKAISPQDYERLAQAIGTLEAVAELSYE